MGNFADKPNKSKVLPFSIRILCLYDLSIFVRKIAQNGADVFETVICCLFEARAEL